MKDKIIKKIRLLFTKLAAIYIFIFMGLMFLLMSIISTFSFTAFFKKFNITKKDVKDKIEEEGEVKSIKYMFMPTRMGSAIIKKKNPELFEKYIKDITKYNLILVITMVTLLFIADLCTLSIREIPTNIFYELYFKNVWWLSCILTVIISIVLIGGISRIVEIFYAFYNDASTHLEKRKETNLKHSERVHLAMRSYLELILWFAILYYMFSAMDKDLFNNKQALNIIDSIYFSGVTITTLGYGDIFPVGWLGKFVIIIEVLSGFALIIVSFTVYVSRAILEMEINDEIKTLNDEYKILNAKYEKLKDKK